MTTIEERDENGTSEKTGELPEGWAETTLDRLVYPLETGSRPKGGVRGIAEGVPSIGGEHLNDAGGFRTDNVKYVPRRFYEQMTRGHIKMDDVLVVKDGATTGKVSLVREDFPFQEAVVNEHVFICRPHEGVEPAFLFYFLFSAEGQARVLENFQGSAQGGINQTFAADTAIPLPPLDEQRRIVEAAEALLARVTAVRGRLERVPAMLRRFRQSVLAAACDGRLTADWRAAHPDVEPAARLLDRIDAERRTRLGRKYRIPTPPDVDEGPELPDGWALTSVEALATVATGATPLRKRSDYYEGGTIPWVTSGAVNEPLITRADQHITPLALRETNAKVFPVGTLLVAMYGEGQTRGRISELGIEAATNQALAALTLEGIAQQCKPFVRLAFLSNYEALRRLSMGGVQPNLSLGIIRATAVLLPPEAEQAEIFRRAGALLSLADKVEARVEKARRHAERTAQAVLAKAFRGQLVPTEAELALAEGRAYESGADLLARLRAAPAAPRKRRRAPAASSQLTFEIVPVRSS